MTNNIMDNIANIKFRLASIEHEKLTLNIQDIDVAEFDDNQLKFQYKIETLIRMSKNTILVEPSIRYLYEEKILLEVSVILNFSIDNLSAVIVVDKENQTINTKADILPTFVSTAYSTLRGIVYARSSEVFLSKYPIPMIEVATLVQKNGITVED